MKACPFCAEQIQDAAVKCRFCGEFFQDRSSGRTVPPTIPEPSSLNCDRRGEPPLDVRAEATPGIATPEGSGRVEVGLDAVLPMLGSGEHLMAIRALRQEGVNLWADGDSILIDDPGEKVWPALGTAIKKTHRKALLTQLASVAPEAVRKATPEQVRQTEQRWTLSAILVGSAIVSVVLAGLSPSNSGLGMGFALAAMTSILIAGLVWAVPRSEKVTEAVLIGPVAIFLVVFLVAGGPGPSTGGSPARRDATPQVASEGSDGILGGGTDPVLFAPREENFEQLLTFVAARNLPAVEDMVRRKEVFLVKGGVRVRVLSDEFLGGRRIEILEGPFLGSVGWVTRESVREAR